MRDGIMQLPSGVRVSLTVERVVVGNGEFEYNVTFTAVPTNRIGYRFGALRRLFIDADREFYPGERAIWLSATPEEEDDAATTTTEEKRMDQKLVQQYAAV